VSSNFKLFIHICLVNPRNCSVRAQNRVCFIHHLLHSTQVVQMAMAAVIVVVVVVVVAVLDPLKTQKAIRQTRGKVRLKRDGTHAETRFRLSPKQMSPFKSAGASVQLNAGSRGVRISVSNAGYTTFRGSVRVLATHSIHQFPLNFPSRASPCAIRFQTHSKTLYIPNL